MIPLNYLILNSQAFNTALASLAGQKGFKDFKTTYNVAKIQRSVAKNINQAKNEYASWIKDFAVLDEAGKPKLAANPTPICPWEIKEEKKEEFYKKVEAFLITKVEINVPPITMESLGDVKLAPNDLLALQPIFDPSAFDDQPAPSAP
jgi:hypothetical protein